MVIKAVYRINERYVVGDDRSIYRLPYKEGKKSFKLRKIKQHRGGYFIDKVFVEKAKIPFEKITPFELINNEKLPF